MGVACIEFSNLSHGQLSLMGSENCAERHEVSDRQRDGWKYSEVRISLNPSQCTIKYICKANLEVLPRDPKNQLSVLVISKRLIC